MQNICDSLHVFLLQGSCETSEITLYASLEPFGGKKLYKSQDHPHHMTVPLLTPTMPGFLRRNVVVFSSTYEYDTYDFITDMLPSTVTSAYLNLSYFKHD